MDFFYLIMASRDVRWLRKCVTGLLTRTGTSLGMVRIYGAEDVLSKATNKAMNKRGCGWFQ